MFSSAISRYVLRALLVGVGAAVPVWVAGQDWKQVVGSGVLAALAYAGIGAAVPAVEPNVGTKYEGGEGLER